MKRIVATLLGGALFVTMINAQSKPAVTFAEGVEVINVDAVSSQLMVQMLYGDQPIPYKKHQHASIILGGLAQACMQVAQIVGSHDKKEKQQAVIGILGTVLGTAALLAGNTSNKLPPASDHAALDETIIALHDQLFESVDQTVIAEGPCLALVKSLPKADRPSWIKILLSSTYARQFLKELLLTTCNYLHQHTPEITAYLKQRVREYLEKKGYLDASKKRQDQRAVDIMVDSVTSAVTKQICSELRNHMLADLSSEVAQRYLVGQVPTYCNQSREGDVAAVTLVDLIKKEISWLMQYVYGVYAYLLMQPVQPTPDVALETKKVLFDWKAS